MKNIAVILLVILSNICYSQKVIINGSILSLTDSLPIANVNVSIYGTNHGVSSDKKGRFHFGTKHLAGYIFYSVVRDL